MVLEFEEKIQTMTLFGIDLIGFTATPPGE
jgi:hypothetical protein